MRPGAELDAIAIPAISIIRDESTVTYKLESAAGPGRRAARGPPAGRGSIGSAGAIDASNKNVATWFWQFDAYVRTLEVLFGHVISESFFIPIGGNGLGLGKS